MKEKIKRLIARLRDSCLSRPLYYLHDFVFLVQQALRGKPHMTQEEISNVEKNVTFIYKSFNRQRQAKRLYRNIHAYYPQARIVIADDSEKPLDLPDVVQLPFNSGLSKGLIAALERVETPYVMRMDDDELLTPASNIHGQLAFLQAHSEVDLAGIQAITYHYQLKNSSGQYTAIHMNRPLRIPAGTQIDGREVVYKTPNVFLARTDKLRLVGYDPNIRMIDHHEFFYRAAGRLVCVQDPRAYVAHCHNYFEKDYQRYREDWQGDARYIALKHGRNYWYRG